MSLALIAVDFFASALIHALLSRAYLGVSLAFLYCFPTAEK